MATPQAPTKMPPRTRPRAGTNGQAPAQNGQANGQSPSPGRKSKSRLPAGMDGNELKTNEDISNYLNVARAELFRRSRELEAMADDFHSAAAVLKRRLVKAEKAQQKNGMRERYQGRMHVTRTMRPLNRAVRAAGDAASAATGCARLLRRFWISWQDAMEDLVPKRRGER